MSAAIGTLIDTGGDGGSVRDWLVGLGVGGADATTAPFDGAPVPAVAAICSSAVAPLEIAAALEAAGMSQQAVQETTHHTDVFSLADELWRTIPHVQADVDAPPCWRRGNVGDLGRGALYAAPALIIQGFATAADVHFQWWTLPLAMTLGWAMGQLTAFACYTMRARNDARGEARVATLLFITSVVVTGGSAWIAERAWGGDVVSVVCSTTVTAYMVASSILLIHEQERLGAILLAPAALGSIAVLAAGDQIAGSIAVAAIAASGAGTLVAVARHLGWPVIRRASVSRTDLRSAIQHFAHGVVCGLALAMVVLVGTRVTEFSSRAAAATIPLLVTLGLMEWRLRTFRADVETLSRSLDAIDHFGGGAIRIFLRGLIAYVVGVVVAAAAVAVWLRRIGEPVPVALFVAEIGLGTLYYVDLTLTSLGRLDVVIRAWITGIVAGGAVFGAAVAFGPDLRVAAWWSAHLAVWTALLILLAAAPRIVAAPCSH